MRFIIILVAIFLTSCELPENRNQCDYERDSLQSLDDCLAHPQCRLTGDEFHIAKQSRRKIAKRCKRD